MPMPMPMPMTSGLAPIALHPHATPTLPAGSGLRASGPRSGVAPVPAAHRVAGRTPHAIDSHAVHAAVWQACFGTGHDRM